MKINVDAGVAEGMNRGTAAALCRDREGAYLGSSMLVFEGLMDPTTLEAIACREGLALAQDLGVNHLQIALDCKKVINHIYQRAGGDHGSIVREILQTSTLFAACNILFEPRESNFVAHRLARFGISLPAGRHLWLGIQHDLIVIPMNILVDQ